MNHFEKTFVLFGSATADLASGTGTIAFHRGSEYSREYVKFYKSDIVRGSNAFQIIGNADRYGIPVVFEYNENRASCVCLFDEFDSQEFIERISPKQIYLQTVSELIEKKKDDLIQRDVKQLSPKMRRLKSVFDKKLWGKLLNTDKALALCEASSNMYRIIDKASDFACVQEDVRKKDPEIIQALSYYFEYRLNEIADREKWADKAHNALMSAIKNPRKEKDILDVLFLKCPNTGRYCDAVNTNNNLQCSLYPDNNINCQYSRVSGSNVPYGEIRHMRREAVYERKTNPQLNDMLTNIGFKYKDIPDQDTYCFMIARHINAFNR